MKSLSRAFLWLCAVACWMTCLQSCKPSIPSQYLSKGEMEDILYDFHVAEAMANTTYDGSENADMIAYKEAVLKKYGVTPAEFDSSMVYYMRHTQLLHDVYVKIGDRLTAEAKSLGADVSEMGRFGDVASGDTANVWKGARSFVLSTNKPFNYQAFSVPVDSGFHKGDQLMLDFETQFIYQDGMRDGIAMLAVTFSNDSVASSYMRMSGSQHYSIQVEDRDSLGIKSIKGYFLLNDGDFNSGASSLTTLKLMFIQQIRLVRLHPRRSPMTTTVPNGPGVPSSGVPRGTTMGGDTTGNAVRPQLASPSTAPVAPPPIPADRRITIHPKKE